MPDFAQKVPGAVAVAGVGTPQVPGTEVAVHLFAADLHHLAADLAFLRSQQVVDERVSPGEVVGVRHPRLVVVAVAGRPARIPFGAVQQNPFGKLAVLVLAAQQTRETERGRTVQRGDGIHPVAPPQRLPLLAAAFHIVRIRLRLGGRRRVLQELFTARNQLLEPVVHRPLGQLAQFRQLFGTDEQSRVRLGNPGKQFVPRGMGIATAWSGIVNVRDRLQLVWLPSFVHSPVAPPVRSGRATRRADNTR